MALTAGAARHSITPPVGIPMSGFVGRGPAIDVHDELFAIALVLSDDRSGTTDSPVRLAIVTLDLIGLYSDDLVGALKTAVQSATGIDAEYIFLSCSHTHYGPVVAERGDMPGGDSALAALYRVQIADVVTTCVREADAARVPVEAHAGRGASRLGVNRRLLSPDGAIQLAPNPAGHVDHEVLVLRLHTARNVEPASEDSVEGRVVATLVNYACHPSSLEARVRSISSDFVGAMRERVDASDGGTTLFLQGAAGDIDPVRKGPEWSIPRGAGEALASEVSRASRTGSPVSSRRLESRRTLVAVPRRSAASVAAVDADLVDLRRRKDALGADATSERWWLDIKIEEAIAAHDSLRVGRDPTIDAEISAVRIGDCAIVFVPAELFSELGTMVKQRSPFPHTMVVGYTDGALWYVPTRSAFDEGGYEVDDACRVAAGAGELIVERALELLGHLAA